MRHYRTARPLDNVTDTRYIGVMINAGFCIHCGTALLAGSRRDALFCSGACRMAHHRAVQAGDILPFARPTSSCDALIDNLRTTLATDESSLEAAMNEVEQAERRLSMARASAKKIAKKLGKDTTGIFSDGAFVPRATAERWLAEEKAKPPESEWLREKRERAEGGPASKTSPFLPMALRAQQDRQPATIEMSETERRENAAIAKFDAASPQEKARMILEAAAKGVRLRSNK